MTSRLPKALFFFAIVPIALGLAGWQGWAWWSWATGPVVTAATTETPEAAIAPVQIQIPTGTSGQQIGRDLEVAGLIRSRLAWDLWSRWQA
ncbi:MAG: aminodeoxychorismate lyase, partial [Cyanobacteria bacterium]|nr:aminodeoxychorismate lyase [Cyanobacteriota bacterium]